MEDDLNILKMENDLNFWEMEDFFRPLLDQKADKVDFPIFENISFFGPLTSRGQQNFLTPKITLTCTKLPNLNYQTIWGPFYWI